MNEDINLEEYYKNKVKYEMLLRALFDCAEYSRYNEELNFDYAIIRNVLKVVEKDMYKKRIAELKGKDNED